MQVRFFVQVRTWLWLPILLCVAACSEQVGPADKADAADTAVLDSSGTLDTGGEDIAAAEVASDDANDDADDDVGAGDVALEDANGDDVDGDDGSGDPTCPGGGGCVCTTNLDCDGGFCLQTLQGKRCAVSCVDTCPAGESCLSTGGTDVQFWCVPSWGLFCRPCQADADCAVPGVAGAACVRYGDAGGFCGSACKADGDCPSGASCKLVPRVQGGDAMQCAAGPLDAAPGCACEPAAVQGQWSTICWEETPASAASPAMRCKGGRSCGDAGLGDCAPLQGAAKQCIDALCSVPGSGGVVAQPNGVACDDGDACTANDTCVEGACTPGTLTCACNVDTDCADDGDLCNGIPYCDKSGAEPVCKTNGTTIVVCDVSLDTACQQTLCNPATGACKKLPTLPGESCDDGVACTIDDHCDGKGACTPGSNTCPCQTSADCPDDADKCNGVPFCDTASTPPSCKANPATLVQCDGSKNTACLKSVCIPASGLCAPTKVPDGNPCDDGDNCTGTDVCADGSCAGVSICGCKSLADCAAFDDDDACNGWRFCDLADNTCKVNPASVVHCKKADDTECLQNTCAPKTGLCSLQATAGACDDGNPCSTGDVCAKGVCAGGTNTCLCNQDADCAAKEDGNLCNGTLFCDKSIGACVPNGATVVTCPTVDDTECVANTCIGKTGACALAKVNEGGPCSDGNACTADDLCTAGACVGGINLCKCASDADCAAADDGDLCNGVAYCDLQDGTCKLNPKSVPVCAADKDTACKASQCVHTFDKDGKTTGTTCALLPRPDGKPCEDGVPCTEGDQCLKGTCTAGKKVCACKVNADCQPAGEVNLCAGTFSCVAGDCKQSGGKQCGSTGNTDCKANACEPSTGNCALLPTNTGKACNDNDICTSVSTCQGGACVGTDALNCNDGNACTADSCAPTKGCVHQALTASTASPAPCSDGSACTTQDGCVAGACKGVPKIETCNGIDDDCNGQTDEENAKDCKAYYLDADKDGYGVSAAASKCLCAATATYKLTAFGPVDCDDTSAAVHPNATEVCNGKDDNCVGGIDELGAAQCTMYWKDGDGDGYPPNADSKKCLCQPAGDYTATNANKLDCNDGVKVVSPGVKESCNGVDDDCDGSVDEENATGCKTYYFDQDNDDYAKYKTTRCWCDGDPKKPSWYRLGPKFDVLDCADNDKLIHPGATEACNGKDDDCDGVTDDQDASGCTNFWFDGDGDGYAAKGAATQCLCVAAGSYTAKAAEPQDCADTFAKVFPGNAGFYETAYSGTNFDYNCDGKTTKKILGPLTCDSSCKQTNPGWIGSVPACGKAGTPAVCAILANGSCGSQSSSTKLVQRCH